MAEKIVIAELDINMDAVIQDTIKLKQEIALLRKNTDEALKTNGALSSEYIQYSAQLKVSEQQLRQNEAMTQKLTLSQKEEIGTISKLEAQNAALRAEQKKLNLTTEEGAKRNKEINDQINANTKVIKENSDTQKQGWMNVGQYTSSINDAMTNLIPGFGQASKAAKMFGIGLNWALLPITAIVVAIMALITYFKRTEEGSNKLNKILAVFGAILNQVMEVVGKVGEAIFAAFENPKKAISDLWELIKTNIMNRLIGFIDAWKAVGKVLKSVFTLDWEGVKQGAAEFGESMIQVATGVDDLFNKAKKAIGDFMDEAAKEAAQAMKIADQKAALRKRERAEVINDARDERDIAELRAKAAQKDKYNGEERLELIEKAIALENAMLVDDMNIAKQKADIHRQEMKMSGESTEALDEQARLDADLFRLQKENAEKRRGFEKQRQSAINDMNEDLRLQAEEAVKLMEYEFNIWQLLNKEKISSSEELTKTQLILEEERLNESERREKEILQKQLDNKLITQNDYNLAILELEVNKNEAIAQINDDYAKQEQAKKLERAKIDYESQQALFDEHVFAQLDRERAANEVRRQEEILAAEKVGADTALINAKYRKMSISLDKAEKAAKLGLAQGFASNVSTIAGENTKVGKAAAAAAATINTYQAATGAYAALAPIPIVGPALGAAAALAATISGIAQVRKIYATKPGDSPSGENSGGGSNVTAGAVSNLQNVNTQLGQGIVSRTTDTGNTTDQNKPIIAVPVDEVTKKQLTESSKIETATI